MKIVQTRSFSWYVFSLIRTEYGDLLIKSPYSVQYGKIQNRKNSLFGYFSRSTPGLLCNIVVLLNNFYITATWLKTFYLVSRTKRLIKEGTVLLFERPLFDRSTLFMFFLSDWVLIRGASFPVAWLNQILSYEIC